MKTKPRTRPDAPPLLADLDPQDVASDVVRMASDYVSSALMRIDPRCEWSIPETTLLRTEALMLTLYAQRGLPVFDWADHGCASDACLDVFAALYTSAGAPEIGGGITDMADDVEPDDAIGVVLLAALARIRLSQRSTIAPRELAVLAGLSDHQVRHLIRSGEIHAEQEGRMMKVSSKEAKRWLSARGVVGL